MPDSAVVKRENGDSCLKMPFILIFNQSNFSGRKILQEHVTVMNIIVMVVG